MRFDNLRKVLFQRIGDLAVEQQALAVQHTRVGCFLHERMLEDIGRIRRLAAGKDQFRCTQLSERRLQWGAGNRCDGGEQAIREFTPERGTDLCNLLDGDEPIETRDQGIVEGLRNRERPQGCGWRCTGRPRDAAVPIPIQSW